MFSSALSCSLNMFVSFFFAKSNKCTIYTVLFWPMDSTWITLTAMMYHSIAVFWLFSPFKIQKGKRNFMLIFCADSIYCKCAQNLTYFQFGMAAAHKQSKICSFLVCVLCSSNSMQNKVLKKSDSEEPINILTECTCAMHIGIRTYVWQICFCSHHFHSYSIFFCVNVKCLN